MTTGRTIAVGVFTERTLAEAAMEELRHYAFTDEQIGFITREGVSNGESNNEISVPGAAAGAVGGGVIGGVIGAVTALAIPGLGLAIAGGILVAMLGGAAIGALAGGFAGSLVELGVPEDEASYYQAQLAAGRTIVTVTNISPERYQEALAIMREHGSSSVRLETETRTNTPTAGEYVAENAMYMGYPGMATTVPPIMTGMGIPPYSAPLFTKPDPNIEDQPTQLHKEVETDEDSDATAKRPAFKLEEKGPILPPAPEQRKPTEEEQPSQEKAHS